MLTYLKYGLAGLFVASLIVLGWEANGWRLKAKEAEGARLELRNEMQRRVEADKQRLAMQIRLSDAEAKIGTGVKIVTKTIREYLHDTVPCRISAPVSDQLRALRAGDFVSPTTSKPATARAAP